MIPYRLAGYDANGNPLTDRDVLSDEERAMDLGWIEPRRERVEIDPRLVETVARLQRGAA